MWRAMCGVGRAWGVAEWHAGLWCQPAVLCDAAQAKNAMQCNCCASWALLLLFIGGVLPDGEKAGGPTMLGPVL